MSYGAIALIATKFSQLANALLGSESLHAVRGYRAVTPVHYDDQVRTQSVDGAAPTFGGSVRYPLPKNSTMIGMCTWQVDISAATLDVGRDAAYVNRLGDQIIETLTLRYGSNIIQSIPRNVFTPAWQRLTRHDNHQEGRNAQVLGGLPPGGATEATRQAALLAGLRLYCPLDELFFVHNKDEFWMPEAYSLEGEIILQIAPLGQLVYSDNGADPFVGAGVAPALSADVMRYQEVTLSAAEKENRLKHYMTEQGHVVHFLDIERQENFRLTGTGGGLNREFRVPLDNFRMDIAEIIFLVRIDDDAAAATAPGVSKLWAGDNMESSVTASAVTGASVACVVPVVSFRLEANGKQIYQEQEELWNRAEVRQRYHPDAQIAEAIYTIPFAAYPEDRKNATGHQSAQVLGKLELVITMLDFAANAPRRVDVYAHSHNFAQSRAGGLTKALH